MLLSSAKYVCTKKEKGTASFNSFGMFVYVCVCVLMIINMHDENLC